MPNKILNDMGNFLQLFKKKQSETGGEKSKLISDGSHTEMTELPQNDDFENLVKMKEATKLIKSSPPTVRKYAKLGYYKEYRFGEKLVYYDRKEILAFILNKNFKK